MSNKRDIGIQGEEYASQYLQMQGYEFLGANVRCGRSEIDLIFKDGNILVFVEVKTRKDSVLVEPEDSVGIKKQNMMIRGAELYLEEMALENEIRFDIVSVILTPGGYRIKHFKDAFWPGFEHN